MIVKYKERYKTEEDSRNFTKFFESSLDYYSQNDLIALEASLWRLVTHQTKLLELLHSKGILTGEEILSTIDKGTKENVEIIPE
jgi:hypothetical protein